MQRWPAETNVGPVLDETFSVSSYAHQFLCSESLDLLVFFVPSGSYSVFSSFSLGLPELWEEGLDGDLQFTLSSLYIMSGSRSLHLFLFAVWQSLSDVDWTRHWSMKWLISLGVSFLILCVVICFCLFLTTRCLGYLVSVSWLFMMYQSWVPSHGVGILPYQTLANSASSVPLLP